jgi:hypothetical protein
VLQEAGVSRRTRLAKYYELGQIERLVPALFALLYAFDVIRQVT